MFLVLTAENRSEHLPAERITLVDIVLVDGPVGDAVHLQVLRGGNRCKGQVAGGGALLDRRLPARPGCSVADV